MDLTKENHENLSFMIETLKKKLQLVNSGLIQPEDYELNKYDDIKELYDMVMKMPSFSIRDMEGIIEELASLKKR
ncbi:DUF1128 domain-containing protein [Fictibacillus phosphorivorans]|uniref:DUF1128 domain-containing protein n=1 Tax=Fictibacillus phosphorivorans TaxID=1221500 RepID=UPI002041D37B|nr:DUF1128 domain-containing protein [Fictibacillus phosphorivorans]MCM3717190.1 DUF1128 domain-containing protein [Fictibacillus phosphorivorans]MCM3774877.1 DUF1128 domain-containing protein [Fictibacillus phosphorivorans]